jgi:hypothetical protein
VTEGPQAVAALAAHRATATRQTTDDQARPTAPPTMTTPEQQSTE